MKKFFGQTRLSYAFFSLSLLAMIAAITSNVLGGSPDDARPADVDKSRRVAKPASAPPPVGPQVAGNGIVEPNGREVKVSAPVAGRVASVDVKEGEHVEKDAVLVTLDSGVERAALAAAEADYQSARAEMTRTLRGQRSEDVDAAIQEARAAQARAEQSRSAQARIKALAAKGGATPDEVEKAEASADGDLATAKAADARMRAATSGSRTEDVLVVSARAEAAKARRDQARASYERLIVRAPSAGEILQMKFRPGEYFVPGGAEPLVVMGDTTKLTVRMDVDERDLSRVSVAAKASVTADAFPGQSFDGRVVEVGRRMGRKNVRTDDPTERKDTKILEVVIELNGTKGLVPGQRVVARVDSN